MNIVLLGPPGAGKGTQAARISRDNNLPHISTGDMFRQAVAEETELGLKAKAYMSRGELVPDDIVIGIVKERLAQPDCQGGFLLDGFPRTVVQAKALKAALFESGRKLDRVLNIDVDPHVLLSRLTARRTCADCGHVYNLQLDPSKASGNCDECGGLLQQREDDTEVTVRKRLDVYQEQTAPLIDYYRSSGLLAEIDGEQGVDEVYSAISAEIGG